MIGRERNGSGSSRGYLEKYSRGRRGAPAKGVGRIYPAREFKSLLLRQRKGHQTVSFFRWWERFEFVRATGRRERDVRDHSRCEDKGALRSGRRRRTQAKLLLRGVMR